MTEKSGFEGSYSTVERGKRRQEVLERAKAGVSTNKIAADLGVVEHAVEQIIEQLRAEGSLPAGATASEAG
jgi:predicted ArsR family transcriptional regulator